MTDSLTTQVLAIMQRAADVAILPRFQNLAAADIVSKAVNDVVTIADNEAEAIIAEGLARLMPEAAVVGEEACHSEPALLDQLGSGLCWIIDPIDGTNNFAAGKRPFGVMVALSEHGETVAGWIYDPVSKRLCHAAAGKGAWIDGNRITARTTGESPPVAANSLVYVRQATRAAVTAAVAPHYRLVDVPRCAAEQYPRLVLGINDVAIFERTMPWDHAAGVLLVNEAGGRAARRDGSAYRVDDKGAGLIGAASPALWEDIATRLNAAIETT